MSKPIDDHIWVKTMVASRTGEPLVVLRWYDHSGELTPTEARAFALKVLAGADAAESDAFIYMFFGSMPGATMQDQAECLSEFRKWREHQQKEG